MIKKTWAPLLCVLLMLSSTFYGQKLRSKFQFLDPNKLEILSRDMPEHYQSLREIYRKDYLPQNLVNNMFVDGTFFRKVLLHSDTPVEVGNYVFQHIVESVDVANSIWGGRFKLKEIENRYKKGEKAYWGSDGENLDAEVFPLHYDEKKNKYAFFCEVTYRERGMTLGGYMLMEVFINSTGKNKSDLEINAYFRIKNGFLNFISTALRKDSDKFNAWLNRSVDLTIEYLAFVGHGVAERYWENWQQQAASNKAVKTTTPKKISKGK